MCMKSIPNDTRRVKSVVKRSSHSHINVTLRTLIDLSQGLRRFSARKGGEYRGACPKCGGDAKSDRFIVWPYDGRGYFWCRQCGIKGDAVAYLVQVEGLSMREALSRAGKEPYAPKDNTLKAQATATIQARYQGWWHEKLREWNTLLDDIRFTEHTYRDQCQKLGAAMSKESYSFWSRRLGDLYFKQTVMQQLLDLNDAERFAAWREDGGK